MSAQPGASRARGSVLIDKAISILAVVFIVLGSKYLVLLVAGTTQTGFVTKAQERFTLPGGTLYSLEYEFFPPGQKLYRGDGAVRSSATPSGAVAVRYLAFVPLISHPGDDALLAFYSGVLIVPGLLLFWGASKSTGRRTR